MRNYDCTEEFKEWDYLIEMLGDNEYALLDLKKYRDAEEHKIIEETDFKAQYGANNERVRKNHLREVLGDTYEKINNLELNINFDKRRISYLRTMIDYKIAMMSYEKGNVKD